MRRATVLFATLFLLGAGTVGYTVYSAHVQRRTHEAEMRLLLEAIDRAEAGTRVSGVRTTTYGWAGTAYTTTLKIKRDGERRSFEVVSSNSTGGHKTKTNYLGGLPSCFRPGYGVHGRFHDPDRVLENYDVRIIGRREVAGREGDVVRILSRHPGRPSYVVVADRETRFPLAFEVRNDGDTRILEMRYESVEFPASFPEGTFGDMKRRGLPSWIRVTETEIALDAAPAETWIPREPPAGFRFVEARTIRIATTRPILFNKSIDVRILHMAYTDGMALFTVVQFARDNEAWRTIRNWLPEVKAQGGIVARKFTCATGVALLIEMEKTVVLLAGNVSSGDIEAAARSLARK